MTYNYDSERQVINGAGTYDEIRTSLVQWGAVVVDWCDERGSLLNVLFVQSPKRVGSPAGGGSLDGRRGRLFVAVIGRGAWAFTQWVAPDYVTEKMKVAGGTAEPLAELINGVLG